MGTPLPPHPPQLSRCRDYTGMDDGTRNWRFLAKMWKPHINPTFFIDCITALHKFSQLQWWILADNSQKTIKKLRSLSSNARGVVLTAEPAVKNTYKETKSVHQPLFIFPKLVFRQAKFYVRNMVPSLNKWVVVSQRIYKYVSQFGISGVYFWSHAMSMVQNMA